MKRLIAPLLASIFGLFFTVVQAHAQYGNLPNQASWNQYLGNHPKTATELQSNPSLIYNSNWRSQHPHFETWANSHPQDWKALHQPAPWHNRYGAFDKTTTSGTTRIGGITISHNQHTRTIQTGGRVTGTGSHIRLSSISKERPSTRKEKNSMPSRTTHSSRGMTMAGMVATDITATPAIPAILAIIRIVA